MNNILIVDDRDDFVNAFVSKASIKGIKVATAKSFEGLKKDLPNIHHKISVIILDIKCLLTDNQEFENEDFIGTAITYLDQYFPRFPRLILTGDEQSYSGYKRFNDEEIFLKTDNEIEKLFDRVKYFCDNSENLSIKREYLQIFEIFEQELMANEQENQILNILKKINEKDTFKFKGVLSDIRSVQEMIYKTINSKDKSIVPDNMFRSNGMIKFNDLMKHLNGHQNRDYDATSTIYQNKTIYNLSNSLYWSCGEYIHEELNRNYMISNMALKSLIYNLLELLIWSKQYLQSQT